MRAFDSATARAIFTAVTDSVHAFEQVELSSGTYGLYTYSSHRAILRRDLAVRLQRQVSDYGVRLVLDGGIFSSAHGLLFKIKAAMTKGKRSTIRELVREENDLIKRVEVTLATVALPEPIAETLRLIHICVSESKLELTKLGAASRIQQAQARVRR